MPNGMSFHLGEFRARDDDDDDDGPGLRWMAMEGWSAAIHSDDDGPCGR
jgi:hypothetical protein